MHALHLGSKVVHTKHSVMGVRVGGGGLLKLSSSVSKCLHHKVIEPKNPYFSLAISKPITSNGVNEIFTKEAWKRGKKTEFGYGCTCLLQMYVCDRVVNPLYQRVLFLIQDYFNHILHKQWHRTWTSCIATGSKIPFTENEIENQTSHFSKFGQSLVGKIQAMHNSLDYKITDQCDVK